MSDTPSLDPPLYDLHHYTTEDFPFKIENRNQLSLNTMLHAHDFFQICFILKGICLHRFGSKTYTLTKGDVLSVPPREPHCLLRNQDEEVLLLQVDFVPWFINENGRDWASLESLTDFLYLQPLLAADHDAMGKLQVAPERLEVFETLLQSMTLEIQNAQPGYRLAVKADLLKFLVLLGREFHNTPRPGQESAATRQYQSRFKEVFQFLETHYKNEITLNELAQKAAMAPSYFSHAFKLAKGVSVMEYLNQIRIRNAMKLLRSSDLNITEISFETGFNHLGHFNRVFRQLVGTTPSQYRKS